MLEYKLEVVTIDDNSTTRSTQQDMSTLHYRESEEFQAGDNTLLSGSLHTTGLQPRNQAPRSDLFLTCTCIETDWGPGYKANWPTHIHTCIHTTYMYVYMCT